MELKATKKTYHVFYSYSFTEESLTLPNFSLLKRVVNFSSLVFRFDLTVAQVVWTTFYKAYREKERGQILLSAYCCNGPVVRKLGGRGAGMG